MQGRDWVLEVRIRTLPSKAYYWIPRDPLRLVSSHLIAHWRSEGLAN